MGSRVWLVILAALWATGIVAGFAFEPQIEQFWRAAGRMLRSVLTCVFCWDWQYDEKPKDGMEPAASLVALAITQLVAFSAYLLHDPHPRLDVGFFYTLIGSLPLVGLGFLVWGKAMNASEAAAVIEGGTRAIVDDVHAFDRQTVRFAGTALFLLGLLFFYTVGSYSQELFPTQITPRPLEFLGARVSKFEEGSEHYEIKAGDAMVVASFGLQAMSMPNPVVVPLSDLEALPKGWRVINAIGYESREGREIESETQPVIDETEAGKPPKIVWSGLGGGLKYRLDVLLHPGKSQVSPQEVAGLIQLRKVLTAKAYIR
jgi:hypothetical protein